MNIHSSHADKLAIFKARARVHAKTYGVHHTAVVYGRSERTIRRWLRDR